MDSSRLQAIEESFSAELCRVAAFESLEEAVADVGHPEVILKHCSAKPVGLVPLSEQLE
jgi:hypothetical protein